MPYVGAVFSAAVVCIPLLAALARGERIRYRESLRTVQQATAIGGPR